MVAAHRVAGRGGGLPPLPRKNLSYHTSHTDFMYQGNTTNNDNRRQFVTQSHYFTPWRRGSFTVKIHDLRTKTPSVITEIHRLRLLGLRRESLKSRVKISPTEIDRLKLSGRLPMRLSIPPIRIRADLAIISSTMISEKPSVVHWKKNLAKGVNVKGSSWNSLPKALRTGSINSYINRC